MSQARIRTTSIAGVLLAATLIAIALSLSSTTKMAQAATALLPSRTLFTDERFTPTEMRVPLAGPVLPESMVAVRGETEGFQLALQNVTAGALKLDARITGDSGAFVPGGVLSPQFLRVGMVNVPVPSTFWNSRTGLYADPLPPIDNSNANGLLTVETGAWGGILLKVRVSTAAPAGTYSGNLELFAPGTQAVKDANGRETTPAVEETIYAQQPFTLVVNNASGGALLQPGAKGAYVTTFGVEGEQYWLGHKAMRNGKAEGYAGRPQRTEQVAGLMSFMDEMGFSPLETSFGVPNKSGSYAGCTYDSTKGEFAAVDFMTQLKTRYFGTGRAIEPGATQHSVRWAPYRTEGCTPDSHDDEFKSVKDPRNTPSLKQDDTLDPASAPFWKNVNAAWSGNGLYTQRTYVKNPFDEPGDASPNQRLTMQNEVPKANKLLHAAFGKRAKVVLAGWPRDERKQKKCGKLTKKQTKPQCFIYELDTYGNRKMWDKKGGDDVDVWMVPVSRLWGRYTQPHLKKLKIDRSLEYAKRLETIRKGTKGETWSYSFYTGDHNTPQTVIDAPGSDQVLLYWMTAAQGHTGLFISNLLMGWSSEAGNHTDRFASVPKKGDPYETALYFRHGSTYGVAAGWGTFVYPPYSERYGLTSETHRNSAAGRPVSSLRMEGMRDGQEDANLMIMYRNRFGQGKLDAQLKAIFPGTYRPQIRSLGQVVVPTYDNANMSQRLETVRRAMIAELAG